MSRIHAEFAIIEPAFIIYNQTMRSADEQYGFKIGSKPRLHRKSMESKGNGDMTVKKSVPIRENLHSTQFQYQRSETTVKSVRNSSSLAQTRSIRDRIEKACPTYNVADMKKENNLLKKELDRLEKQIFKKDQQLLDLKASSLSSKQSKAEMEQLYQTLHYYEGSTRQLEQQIQKFRQMILTSNNGQVTEQDLKVLFNVLSKDNEELEGQLERNAYIQLMQANRYKKLEAAYFSVQRELAEFKRKQASPLNHLCRDNTTSLKKVNKVVNTLLYNTDQQTPMQSKESDVLLKWYSEQMAKTQEDIAELKEELKKMEETHSNINSENNILRLEIKAKDEQITDLFEKYANLRKSLKKIESTKTLPYIN